MHRGQRIEKMRSKEKVTACLVRENIFNFSLYDLTNNYVNCIAFTLLPVFKRYLYRNEENSIS